MTNFQIDEMALRFEESEDALYSYFVDEYRKDIYDMPEKEQAVYWDKFQELTKHLQLTRYIIHKYYDEINSRVSYVRNNEQNQYIKTLRKYIEILGGDPTNCSYIKSSDL
jgi:hypothetical protein